MPHQPLTREFFDRSAIAVARELLGKLLLRRTNRTLLIGRIVETEAYLSKNDPACHAARGRTRRNESMFGPPGQGYVYSIHAKYCFNIVTEAEGVPSAVLVRAVEPLVGAEEMRNLRGDVTERQIGNGPAKLCQAMTIDRRLDGWDLTKGQRLWTTADGTVVTNKQIGDSERIGVTSARELALRFYLRNNQYVSGPKRMRQ